MNTNDRLASIPAKRDEQANEHEIHAAVVNAVLVRCRQNGRSYFTAEDARASRLLTLALMKLEPCAQETIREGTPQTMPRHTEVTSYAAVERALTLGPDDGAKEAPEQKRAMPVPIPSRAPVVDKPRETA